MPEIPELPEPSELKSLPWFEPLCRAIERAVVHCHDRVLAASKVAPPSLDALRNIAQEGADKIIDHLPPRPQDALLTIPVLIKQMLVSQVGVEQKFIEAQRRPRSGEK